jgi:hypothetical protein
MWVFISFAVFPFQQGNYILYLCPFRVFGKAFVFTFERTSLALSSIFLFQNLLKFWLEYMQKK